MVYTQPDTVFSTCNSAKILESLKEWEGQQFPVEIHARNKDEAHNTELFQNMINIISNQGVGNLRRYAKDKKYGWIGARQIEVVDFSFGATA